MLEESASSIWTSMNSWFTPTVLFLLLNLIIGTIVFTSTLSKQKQHQHKHPQNIARSPSVLHLLKSINSAAATPPQPHPQDSSPRHKQKQNQDSDATQQLDHYFFHHQAQETQTHYIYEKAPQETQFDLDEKNPRIDDFEDEARELQKVEENDEKSIDDVYTQLTDSRFSRTKSDTKPASGEIPAKLPAKMRKSASAKSAFAHFEEEDIVEARRPATVRERGKAKATEAADEGVDAKADDFINRFKQQLKLQRLDSIIRYKDMIGRGR